MFISLDQRRNLWYLSQYCQNVSRWAQCLIVTNIFPDVLGLRIDTHRGFRENIDAALCAVSWAQSWWLRGFMRGDWVNTGCVSVCPWHVMKYFYICKYTDIMMSWWDLIHPSQPGPRVNIRHNMRHRGLISKLYIRKVSCDSSQHIWYSGIMRLGLRAENQFLVWVSSWHQSAQSCVKWVPGNVTAETESEIYTELSDIFILHHSDARPVIRICILIIFSSLLLNVSYLNLMFLQYSTYSGYWPSYEWPGLCQAPSCQ